MIESILAAIRNNARGLFMVCEHLCALGYAVKEFYGEHLALKLASLGLLIAAILFLVSKAHEKGVRFTVKNKSNQPG
jgi:hypothetical protein